MHTHINNFQLNCTFFLFSLYQLAFQVYIIYRQNTKKCVWVGKREQKRETDNFVELSQSFMQLDSLFSLVTFFLSIFCKTTRKWRNCFVFFSQMIVVAQQKMSIMMISILLKRIPTWWWRSSSSCWCGDDTCGVVTTIHGQCHCILSGKWIRFLSLLFVK